MDDHRPRSSDLTALYEQARQGSRHAVLELFEIFRHVVRSRIRQRMPQRLRTIADSEDFTQDIGIKLLSHDVPAEVFESQARFLGYLAQMAINQVGERARYYLQARKRSLRREVHVESNEEATRQSLARQEPVNDAATIQDRYDHWQRSLPLVKRRILVLLRAGQGPAEIAADLLICERTVRRFVKSLRNEQPV
jgi:RNA polymerase sigma factor (sigma-70 family)